MTSRRTAGRDIVPDIAAFRSLGQQVLDEAAELPLRSGEMLTSMQA